MKKLSVSTIMFGILAGAIAGGILASAPGWAQQNGQQSNASCCSGCVGDQQDPHRQEGAAQAPAQGASAGQGTQQAR